MLEIRPANTLTVPSFASRTVNLDVDLGALAIRYVFSTTITDGDPGNGKLRLSATQQDAALTIRADTLDVNGADVSGLLDAFDDSTSATKGHIRIYAVGDPTKWLTFAVTALASPAGYRNITVSNVAASETSPFEDGDTVLLTFTPAGQRGQTGPAGSGNTYDTIALASGATIDPVTGGITVLGYSAAGDGGGALYNRVAFEPSHPGKFQSADGAWWEIAEEVIWTAMLGADTGSVADQSAIVQDAIDVIGARGANVGGTIVNNRGVQFNWKNITGVQRFNMWYWRGDDVTPNNLTSYVTNEWTLFIANANDAGIVNEEGIRGSYHPSRTTGLDNHLALHDAFLGAGQVRVPTANNPARMSNLWQHSGWDAVYMLYKMYGAPTRFNNFTIQTWNRVVRLFGINANSFSPALGLGQQGDLPFSGMAVISGTTSGAIGWLKEGQNSSLDLFWQHGVFEVGETVQLVENIGEVGETIVFTTTDVVTSISEVQTANAPISWGQVSGAIGIGLQSADFQHINVGLGGYAGVGAADPVGTNQPYGDTTRVRFGLANNYALPASSRSGRHFEWDLNVAAAFRRLTLKRDSDDKNLGQVGAVARWAQMNNAGLVGTKGHLVSAVTRVGTGLYTVSFTEALPSADYIVVFGGNGKANRPTADGLTTSGFSIYNYDSAGAALDVAFTLGFAVIGGDI